MFMLFMGILIFLTMVGFSVRGPILALSLSWLITCAPIGLDLVRYNYFDKNDIEYCLLLSAYILVFVVGALFAGVRVDTDVPPSIVRTQYDLVNKLIPKVWLISILAILFQILDFVLYGAADAGDLAGLRDFYQNRTSSPLTLLVNVTSWSCLYCYAYAIYYKDVLNKPAYVRYISPAIGYFLLSLFSAGRQAAFQLMLFAIVLHFCRIGSLGSEGISNANGKKGGGIIFVAIISLAMIVYMGVVAVYRNDGAISEDKIILLVGIFDFQLSDWFDSITDHLPRGIKAALVESMVYFSSCISLFSEFIRLEKSGDFGGWGVMTFPFAMRQIEFITGKSVIGALQDKVALMYSLGAMGNGWTTGVSSYILDFGYWGGAGFMGLVGYYSQWTWNQMKRYGDFNRVLIASLLLINAVYLPFLLGSAETNLFLAWLFAVGVIFSSIYLRKQG